MTKLDLSNYEGVWMSSTCSFPKFKEAIEYVPKEGDVFVSSYHKCGTTWMQYIVYEIMNDCRELPYVHEMIMDFGNQIEKLGIRKPKDDGFKRHFKSHLPFNRIPYNEKAKYIYIVRNPWDVCVSYFNMLTQMPKYNVFSGTFDEFFDEFIDGHMECGGYFDHVVSWYREKPKSNILYLTFEEAKRNPKETVLKIAEFLDSSYYKKFAESDEQMQKILQLTSFECMKQLPLVLPNTMDVVRKTGIYNVGRNIDLVKTGDYISIEFFKAGRTAYTKDHYSDQQKDVMKRKIRQHFNQFPELLNIWKEFNVDV